MNETDNTSTTPKIERTVKLIGKNHNRTQNALNVILLFSGTFIFINAYQLNKSIFPYLKYSEVWFYLVSITMISIPISTLSSFIFEKYTKRLSSIDDKKENKLTYQFNNTKTELNTPSVVKIPYIKTKERNKNLENSDSFKKYFSHIINNLESKSSDADKKASILLDNGKFYSMIGIFYFIISIIVWQIYITNIGFAKHHIYGIISSSLVFIFIEFLSAWYLRQYKSFSDTSTYLTKIKSIFDKYMLIYLISKENDSDDFGTLLEQLSSDIKWPETYLLKNADISFAKEALETMTTMAQAFKKEAQNK